MVTKEQITKAIEGLIDPSNGKTLKENDGVRKILLDEENNKVHIIIGLEKKEFDTSAFQRDLLKILKIDLGIGGVKIEYTALGYRSKSESAIIGLGANVNFVAIASGKGGVGKSTVSANVAVALSRLGKKVGLIDADIYGSSILKIMELDVKSAMRNNLIIPAEKHGVEIIATDMIQPDNKPLMWRGPMLNRLLNHYFNDVDFSEDLEYVIVDLPPGTGDVAIDIQTLIPQCKQIVVTTPHPSASAVAVRAGMMAKDLEHQLIGVVENMAYLDHKGERIHVFGEGGGKLVARELDTPLIATLPLAQPKNGEHHSIFNDGEAQTDIYNNIAQTIIDSFE
jgi:ATP-binding protein involved in chromosome partitioning